MGGRALTLWRWTARAKSTGLNWQVRCYLDGATRQISTDEEDIKRARKASIDWYASGTFLNQDEGI